MQLYVEITWDNGIHGCGFEEVYVEDLHIKTIIDAFNSNYGQITLLIQNSKFIELESKFKGVFRVYLPI